MHPFRRSCSAALAVGLAIASSRFAVANEDRKPEFVQVTTVAGMKSGMASTPIPTTTAPDPDGPCRPIDRDADDYQYALILGRCERGWGEDQFRCLATLWNRESSWRVHAGRVSASYGIPQAYPGRKMAAAGADWEHNGRTQIRWGLQYIADRYRTPCAALAAWDARDSRGRPWY